MSTVEEKKEAKTVRYLTFTAAGGVNHRVKADSEILGIGLNGFGLCFARFYHVGQYTVTDGTDKNAESFQAYRILSISESFEKE